MHNMSPCQLDLKKTRTRDSLDFRILALEARGKGENPFFLTQIFNIKKYFFTLKYDWIV